MPERRLSPKAVESLGLLKREEVIVPDKTLFVENCPLDFPPNLAAAHNLRVAVQNGCEKISVKRGRWRYEFQVKDFLPKVPIVSEKALGPSAISLKQAGYDFGTFNGPGKQVLVSPPWNQPEALGEGEKNGQ